MGVGWPGLSSILFFYYNFFEYIKSVRLILLYSGSAYFLFVCIFHVKGFVSCLFISEQIATQMNGMQLQLTMLHSATDWQLLVVIKTT